MVQPSCQALVILDDDQFRKTLIATLDQQHFAVTYAAESDAAEQLLASRRFRVIILGLDLKQKKGVRTLEYLRQHRDIIGCGVLILGEPDPDIRSIAPWADETLLKPVDAAYVATRAQSYCGC